MRTEKTRERVFTRRAVMLLGGQLALFAGLGARMYYLQVQQADRYRTLADENRINIKLLSPPRGFIVDRFGEPLAINVQNYRLLLVPEQAKDVPATLDKLSRLIELTDRDKINVLRKSKRRRAFVPITVKENLSWAEVSRFQVNAVALPGVDIDVGLSRFYPQGSAVSHILGYVSKVSEKERTADDPLLDLPDFRIGKRGIEKKFDKALRGSAGTSQVEVNAIGRVIRELRRQEGQPGQEIALTIDSELQNFVAERLADEKSASVVLLDAQAGDVLALYSKPSFNPNAFNEGLSQKEWRGLVDNPLAPLTNKAIAGQYSPGSTFKIAVMLAALKAGIKPDHSVYCNGSMELGNRRFHCWKKHGHGRVDMTDSMRASCDIWYYDVALKLGIDKISAAGRELGLGAVLGLDIDGEKPGLMPTRAWKKAELGQTWQRGETLVGAIGQGFVLATPLQLATMTARIVNGGRAVVPRLTRPIGALIEGDFEPPETIGFDERHLRLVANSMAAVVNHPRGTAYKARIEDPRFNMGGKTGTVQVRRISAAERETGVLKNEDLPWERRDHALFVGFAPVETPRYAISVVVEHGGGGSSAAAPIARDILKEAQLLDPLGRPARSQVAQANSRGASE